jgi:hypothetical protein
MQFGHGRDAKLYCLADFAVGDVVADADDHRISLPFDYY